MHQILTRGAEMNEVVWCAKSPSSFLEGLPLSLGRRMVFRPGGREPFSLAGLWAHTLRLSSRGRTTRRSVHTSCSGGLPWSSEAGARILGRPPHLSSVCKKRLSATLQIWEEAKVCFCGLWLSFYGNSTSLRHFVPLSFSFRCLFSSLSKSAFKKGSAGRTLPPCMIWSPNLVYSQVSIHILNAIFVIRDVVPYYKNSSIWIYINREN